MDLTGVKDLDNIIMDYVLQLEVCERFKNVLRELVNRTIERERRMDYSCIDTCDLKGWQEQYINNIIMEDYRKNRRYIIIDDYNMYSEIRKTTCYIQKINKWFD